MALIVNPNPIVKPMFTGMWISNLQIVFPGLASPNGLLNAKLLPYDGTYLLATGGKDVRYNNLRAKMQLDPLLKFAVDNLKAEITRLSGSESSVKLVNVFAADPTKPVVATMLFDTGPAYTVHNCFARTETDPIFANVFFSMLGEIARQAGLNLA